MKMFVFAIMMLSLCAELAMSQGHSVSSKKPILGEEALCRAIECLGLEDERAAGWCDVESIELVTASHDQFSPVGRDFIDGRQAWEIRLSNVVLELKGTRPRSNAEHPRAATIYVGALTGQLLKFVVLDTTWTDTAHDVPWNRLISNAGGVWGGGLSLAPVCPVASFADAFGEQSLRNARVAADAIDFVEEQQCYSSHPLLAQQAEIYPVVFDHGTGDVRPPALPADNVPAWLLTLKSYRSVDAIGRDAESLAVYQPTIVHRVIDPSTTEPCLSVELTFPDPGMEKLLSPEERDRLHREKARRNGPDSIDADSQ